MWHWSEPSLKTLAHFWTQVWIWHVFLSEIWEDIEKCVCISTAWTDTAWFTRTMLLWYWFQIEFLCLILFATCYHWSLSCWVSWGTSWLWHLSSAQLRLSRRFDGCQTIFIVLKNTWIPLFEIHLYKTVEYTVRNQSMAGIHFPLVCFDLQQIWDSFTQLDSLFELFLSELPPFPFLMTSFHSTDMT